MPFQASINIGGEDFNVLHVDMDFNIPFDPQSHRPAGKVQPGLVNLTVISGNDNILPLELYNWCVLHQTKNGSIVFYKADNAAALKTLSFKGAYCLKYKEVFDAVGAEPMKIYISISPASIKMYDSATEFVADWGNDVESSGSPAGKGGGEGGVSTFDAS